MAFSWDVILFLILVVLWSFFRARLTKEFGESSAPPPLSVKGLGTLRAPEGTPQEALHPAFGDGKPRAVLPAAHRPHPRIQGTASPRSARSAKSAQSGFSVSETQIHTEQGGTA